MKLALLLLILVIGSALAVIYAKHESRLLFGDLQKLQAERDRLNIEWGRLQLEQSAWATNSRVEKLARERLNMVVPDPETVVIIKP